MWDDGIEELIASKGEEWPPYIPFHKCITNLEGLLSINSISNSISETCSLLKTGFRGYSDFGFWILWDLASTYVLCRPCSLSLYFRISWSSGWSDLVVSEERNLSWFQNWRIMYMNEGLIYWVRDRGWGQVIKNNLRLEGNKNNRSRVERV